MLFGAPKNKEKKCFDHFQKVIMNSLTKCKSLDFGIPELR
jgi:hypothetical protein